MGNIQLFDPQTRQLLVHLVDDLLDVSRITQGRLALQCQKLLLTEVLASAVEATRTLIEAHAHHLVLDIRPTKPVIVDGDSHRLTQVFSNLLSNSVKYTDRGGTITLTLTLDCEGANAVVSVRDTGVGIAGDHLESVFEMFSQIRSEEARSDGGLGIGLSLVRTLTRMHGGSVSASSEGVGKGSTFTVRLPLAQNAATSVTEPVGPVSLSPGGRAQRVLVVDDNGDAAEALAALLQMSGHEVHTANDGAEALERVQQLRPTLVFMDVGMPRMDGLEAARRIRALPFGHDIHIIALTGWGQEEDRQITRSAGMDHHLVKPVSIDALQEVLERVNRQEGAP